MRKIQSITHTQKAISTLLQSKEYSFDETQRAFYNFFREFALRTGINVELFSSKEKLGKYQGEQGSWNKNTKTIRIDINAGLKNVSDRKEIKHGMLNTFSHELTHIAELSGFLGRTARSYSQRT